MASTKIYEDIFIAECCRLSHARPTVTGTSFGGKGEFVCGVLCAKPSQLNQSVRCLVRISEKWTQPDRYIFFIALLTPTLPGVYVRVNNTTMSSGPYCPLGLVPFASGKIISKREVPELTQVFLDMCGWLRLVVTVPQ